MKVKFENRQENQRVRRLKSAIFPYSKTLEEFDYSQLSEVVSPTFLKELATCDFIKKKKNIVIIGNLGRGKTHLSISLRLKACDLGHKVLFSNASTLSTQLCVARDRYQLGKLERQLEK